MVGINDVSRTASAAFENEYINVVVAVIWVEVAMATVVAVVELVVKRKLRRSRVLALDGVFIVQTVVEAVMYPVALKQLNTPLWFSQGKNESGLDPPSGGGSTVVLLASP